MQIGVVLRKVAVALNFLHTLCTHSCNRTPLIGILDPPLTNFMHMAKFTGISHNNLLNTWLCKHYIITPPTCPCPREIDWHLLLPKPLSSANLSRPAIGSAPGDNTKINGAQQLESAKLPARSKVGGSMYCLPMFSTTKFCTAGTILSGRIQRRITNLWKKERKKGDKLVMTVLLQLTA